MKTLGMLLASAALCGSAQATVFEYDFTVTIQEMLEFSPVTGTGGMVNSSTLAGDALSVGDVVYGHFSYDTETAQFGNFGVGPVYAASGASNSLSAGTFSHNLALHDATANNTMVQVSNNAALLGGGDSLAIGNTSENAAATQLMAVDFFDRTGTALSSDAIPGAIDASAFNQTSFYYLYTAKDSHTMLGANGALTSLTLVSSVPEPQTYAMLFSGLGMLAGLARRRSKASK
ncbi:PEP-CTERM protein-sorting domain-containing protein [Duganella sp. CF402]|uniref:PEP-CTERM sorting domain-containing protein n=1 Tax=unclassified Duganella TaxID=2636909 RepID=UPI0008B1B38E|nr:MULTISPECIES: PEP-CTERM sorting domain-containing protein [unclassified Duganella]RZT10229.1 putative secreted protein with PEP-CTERM sorting signal [Duganella sp. BK701]SEL22618.1 PEP-CTERM protein-sorting domain-containing protein [Duganella sp. CF402]